MLVYQEVWLDCKPELLTGEPKDDLVCYWKERENDE